MGQPELCLSSSAMVQRLLRSWSRKELGDSEPFGLLLMLVKVSVLASLKQRICLLLRDTSTAFVSEYDHMLSSFWSCKMKQALQKGSGNGGNEVGMKTSRTKCEVGVGQSRDYNRKCSYVD